MLVQDRVKAIDAIAPGRLSSLCRPVDGSHTMPSSRSSPQATSDGKVQA